MTHLLQYFPQLSLRPENLPELRSLILQLAVEGKLTAEWRKANPDVEPASELLARIEAEKAELVKAKQIKKSKPLPPVNEDNMPFNVPDNWSWCHMQDICSIITDGTHHRPTYIKDGIPFLSVKNISKGYLDFSDTKFISQEEHEKLIKRCHPEYHDVLLTKVGTTGIGKVIDTRRDFSIFVSVALLKIFKDELNPYFLEHLINSPLTKSQSAEGTEGVGNKNLVLRKIKAFYIPLPPLPEQQAIVQTVDALLQELDQLQQRTETRLQLKTDYATVALRRLTTAPAVGPAWEALAPHFRTFFDETGNVQSLRAAILQLAVQGKLTAQWRKAHPDVEPATELLSRIQAEKAALVKAKKIKKEKPLPPVDAAEVPFGVPEGWVWCRLGEIQLDIEAGKSPKCHSTPAEENQWGVIKMSAISWGIFNSEENKTLPADIPPFIDKEIMPKDFILTRANTAELIARSVVVPDDCRSKLLLNDKTLRVIFSEALSIKYLNLYNNSFSAREYYAINSSGTSNSMKNISRAAIKGLPVPLPPLSEQHAIVQAVEELLGLCTALEEATGRRDVVLGDWVRAVVAGV